MYFVIHRDDDRLIGNCGFKGAPNAEGMVEIGYAIAPAYEGRGYATEVAQGLTDRAFASPYVKMVDAHTLAEENASTSVLRKIGMKWVEEIIDPEDGKIWHWRITREEYEKGRLSPNLP
jgi:RimJ/RimL family protein N-acetyltransferase